MSTAIKQTSEPKDRIYKLVGREKPLSFVLASRSTKAMPLLYFDEKTNKNRILRYATNFPSPFLDDQNGEAVLSEIIFDKGILVVPKNNPALQEFLKFHPGLNRVYTELDPEAEAEKEMERMSAEEAAIIAVSKLSTEQYENLYRVLFGKDPMVHKTAVVVRDIKVYARTHPSDLLNKLGNPALSMQSDIRLLFDRRVLAFRNGQDDIHYNLKDNKKRLIAVPMGKDPYRELQAYFETEEGIEVHKLLINALEDF